MRILGMGTPELIIIIIVIVVLIIFGPKNLPKLGNAIGQCFKNLRKGFKDEPDKKSSKNDSDAKKSSENKESQKYESDNEN